MRLTLHLVLMLACMSALIVRRAAGADEAPGAKGGSPLEFFERKVRPVLAEHCQGCHGPEKQKAGLRLDSRQGMMRGGDGGPIIAPGRPEESRLIEVIRYDADIQMPPKRKLEESEIAALAEWVRQGAHWPEANPAGGAERIARAPSAALSEADRAFWSFQPIRDPEPPAVREQNWARTPIDRFILAKLEAKGLHPVGAAEPVTLLRRMSFDLTGLPPTPDELETFEAALRREPRTAIAQAVERLLASPRYGERWGRYWLDLARFGEDQAHSFQPRLYPYGWRYRDWVARSLNEDKPYDRFVVEQIAGDLLEGPDREGRLAATGLFATGPVYYGKAVYDELDDRVDVVSRVFLGLTVACARCHDHKFDPIPQTDYTALAGVFWSTDYQEVPTGPPAAVARYKAAQAAIQRQSDSIDAYLKTETERLVEQTAAVETARYVVGSWLVLNQRKSDPKADVAEVAQAERLEAEVLERWVAFLTAESAAEKPYLAAWRRFWEAGSSRPDRSSDREARAEVERLAEALQADLQATLELRDTLRRQRTAAEANRGKASDEQTQLGEQDGAFLSQVAGPGGPFRVAKDQVERKLPKPIRDRLRGLRTELERLKKEAPEKFPIIHALAEKEKIENLRVHLRGNPDNLGDEVPRHFLSVLSPSSPRAFTTGSGRLELARAIASESNPLTARVLVNRVWAHHFGRGLVGTPSNFGHMGEPPTHPELLDYLASRLIESGWSIKALHRAILLSSTYQLASTFDATNQEADPENHLLWRANRRRLEIEAWRDAMLAVTGELDPRIGGPSEKLSEATNHRRTYYAFISRHNLDGLLRLFDFPDPNLTSDRRPITSAPPQQLFVLNSPFMLERARALAARLAALPEGRERIERAYRLLYGRAPTERERGLAAAFLGTDGPSDPGAPTLWQQYAQALLASNEFLYVD